MGTPPHRQEVVSLLRSSLCAKLQVCLRLEPLSEEIGGRFKHFQQFGSELVSARTLDIVEAYLSTCFGAAITLGGVYKLAFLLNWRPYWIQTCIFAQLAPLLDTKLHFCTERAKPTEATKPADRTKANSGPSLARQIWSLAAFLDVWFNFAGAQGL